MRDDFCVMILTHGRPGNVKTHRALRNSGYTGKIFLILDDEDGTAPAYSELYGDDVVTFSKAEVREYYDQADNSADWRTIFYARNASFDIARQLGYRFFLQLDDDYRNFVYRRDGKAFKIKSLDRVFDTMLELLEVDARIATVAFSQGGDLDHIWLRLKRGEFATLRKAMNSFFCDTEKPFPFLGRLNEDVNTYVALGHKGLLFFTIYNLQLTQTLTQSNPGGMTDAYLEGGTYVKSFYPVMFEPSCVKIGNMGFHEHRIHHVIDWNAAVPKILREENP